MEPRFPGLYLAGLARRPGRTRLLAAYWRRLILAWCLLFFRALSRRSNICSYFMRAPRRASTTRTPWRPWRGPPWAPGRFAPSAFPISTTPSNFSKIYVVRNDAVVVLEPQPPFATRANASSCARPSSPGERSAVLTPGRQAAGSDRRALRAVFDATDPANPQPVTIDLGDEITGLTALPNSERAFATVLDSDQVEVISLNSNPPVAAGRPDRAAAGSDGDRRRAQRLGLVRGGDGLVLRDRSDRKHVDPRDRRHFRLAAGNRLRSARPRWRRPSCGTGRQLTAFDLLRRQPEASSSGPAARSPRPLSREANWFISFSAANRADLPGRPRRRRIRAMLNPEDAGAV